MKNARSFAKWNCFDSRSGFRNVLEKAKRFEIHETVPEARRFEWRGLAGRVPHTRLLRVGLHGMVDSWHTTCDEPAPHRMNRSHDVADLSVRRHNHTNKKNSNNKRWYRKRGKPQPNICGSHVTQPYDLVTGPTLRGSALLSYRFS
ncbi:hypothetical protein PIB30_046319 [Stylosanthes scabra]|uniref:Uncharacterized protein n=1 Tax=Stylosanthes scabra TaxID=79078 RepID=A0ABU6TG42_9FABA|nr:hypothetical protein [Stylosanthes scabra]